jgi:hypothetical protein
MTKAASQPPEEYLAMYLAVKNLQAVEPRVAMSWIDRDIRDFLAGRNGGKDLLHALYDMFSTSRFRSACAPCSNADLVEPTPDMARRCAGPFAESPCFDKRLAAGIISPVFGAPVERLTAKGGTTGWPP